MKRFLKEVAPSSIKHIVRYLKVDEPSSNDASGLHTSTSETTLEIVEKHKYKHDFTM